LFETFFYMTNSLQVIEGRVKCLILWPVFIVGFYFKIVLISYDASTIMIDNLRLYLRQSYI